MLKRNKKIKRVIAYSQVVFLIGMVSHMPLSTIATVNAAEATQNSNMIFTMLDSYRNKINASIKITDAFDSSKEIKSVSNLDGCAKFNLDENVNYNYEIFADGYEKVTGQFTYSKNINDVEIHMVKKDENKDIPSAPRVKGYVLNEDGQTEEYNINKNSESVKIAIDNSYVNTKIIGYKIIIKNADDAVEPTEDEWTNAKEESGNEVNTLNGMSMVKEIEITEAGKKKIFVRAVSDSGKLGLISTFDVNIEDKFASVYINNKLADNGYNDKLWLNKIPNVQIINGNNPKYTTEYALINNDDNNVIKQGEVTNNINVNIDDVGNYKLVVLTKDNGSEINRTEKDIKIETECLKPNIDAYTIDLDKGNEIYKYIEGQWTNRDITIKASDINTNKKNGLIATSGIKGYKVILKKSGEERPTKEEWNSIDESEIIKNHSNSSVTDIVTISSDFDGYIYIKAVSNANTESDAAEINVRERKIIPKTPEISLSGINELGWYTNEIKKESITINKEINKDINITTYAKVWNEETENSSDVENIDISNGNYDEIIKKINSDGKYKIQLWSVDEAGNSSDLYEKEVKVDKNTPTDYSIEYQSNELYRTDIYNIYRDVVKVRIYVMQDFSGIKAIVPKIKNEFSSQEIPYNNLSIKTTDNGTNYVEFEVKSQFMGKISVASIEDNSGNKSDENTTYNLSEDKSNCIVDFKKPTEPTIDSTIGVSQAKYNKGSWTKDDVKIDISGSKALSGVAYYEYIIKGCNEVAPVESDWDNAQRIGEEQLKKGNIIDNSNEKINLGTISKDTKNIYYIRAVSRAGIVGESSSIEVKVRKSIPDTPVVKIKSSNSYGWYTEKLFSHDISYFNNDTDIGLTTYAQVVNVNDKNDSKTFDITKFDKSGSISDEVLEAINREGQYNLRIYTIDEAGNRSKSWPNDSDGYLINNDYSAPNYFTIQYNFAPISKISGYDIFKDNCVVRIYSKDDISGIKEINYHMEDEYKSRTFKTNGTVKKDGDRQYVEFSIEPQYKRKVILDSVINNAGLETIINFNNSLTTESGETKNIIVDNNKPTKPLISSGSYVNNTWTNSNVNLQIESSKALSGIKNYRYIVNNGEVPSENEWNNSAVLNGHFENNNLLNLNENLIANISNLNSDLNKTYWFRAESNAGILGEISSYNVKIQKSAPRNTTIEYEEPNSEGWYSKSPYIKLNDIKPLERQAPIYIHYKLWNKSVGETENSVNEVIYDGSNLPAISNDGEYSLRVWTVDEVGNRSDVAADVYKDFNYDSTMPIMSLNYDNNNSTNDKYYSKSRNAILSVNDTNFNPNKVKIKVTSVDNGNTVEMSGNSWSSDGIVHSVTIPFDSDGDYKIEAMCSDKAGNVSNNINDNDFVIDMTAPTLDISNVQDLSANNTDVNPVIQFNDTNIDFDNVEYSVTGLQNGVVSAKASQSSDGTNKNISLSSIDKDDNYVLVAKAIDKAGNSVDKKVAFSVNKNGSTFEYLSNNIKNGYVTEKFKPEIKINNIDEVTILSLTLNGKPVEYIYEDGILKFNNEIEVDGKYIINLDVKDAAGNTNTMEPIEFILDKSKPKVLIDGVEDGKTYKEKVQVTVSKDNSSDTFNYIELNGKDMLEEGTINPDGSVTFEVLDYDNYNLKVKAFDDAGNVTDQEINFKISKSIFTLSNKKVIELIIGAIVILLGGIFVKLNFFNNDKGSK